MDSGSRTEKKFDLHPDTWAVDRIVLFASAEGAKAFLENVFPHLTNCIVASRDGLFPENEQLKKKVFESIENDERLRLVVFHFAALRDLKLKSDRLLVLDDWILPGFKKYEWERDLAFDFNAEKLAGIIEAFFGQWDKLERIGNVGFAYDQFSEYAGPVDDWRRRLFSQGGGVVGKE